MSKQDYIQPVEPSEELTRYLERYQKLQDSVLRFFGNRCRHCDSLTGTNQRRGYCERHLYESKT